MCRTASGDRYIEMIETRAWSEDTLIITTKQKKIRLEREVGLGIGEWRRRQGGQRKEEKAHRGEALYFYPRRYRRE